MLVVFQEAWQCTAPVCDEQWRQTLGREQVRGMSGASLLPRWLLARHVSTPVGCRLVLDLLCVVYLTSCASQHPLPSQQAAELTDVAR